MAIHSMYQLKLYTRGTTRSVMKPTPRQTMLSLWNPFCAGTILSYVAHYPNVDGGSLLIDSVAQLRITLHLFNALKQIGAMETGHIPLLDRIFEAFKNSKTVWAGQVPTRGQLCLRWWMAFGMKARVAQERSGRPGRNPAPSYNRDISRALTHHDPAQLSRSYSRICRHDCKVMGEAHDDRTKYEPVHKHVLRVKDTLNVMTDEKLLLATNLISLGNYLHHFCIDLFVEMGWMQKVEAVVREVMKEERGTYFSWKEDGESVFLSMAHVLADLLGYFDSGDITAASSCANFMNAYFSRIPPEKILWFVPMRDEDE